MAKTPKTPKSAKSAETPKANKRKARVERFQQANTINFAVDPAVRRHLIEAARAEGLDLSHYMQMLVEGHIVASAPKGHALAVRLAAKREVIDAVRSQAQKMAEAGDFDEHFILNVIRKAEKTKGFAATYEAAVTVEGDDDKAAKKSESLRKALNQQLGRVIKKTAGARSLRQAGGKIARAQAQDALITTYTLLDKAA